MIDPFKEIIEAEKFERKLARLAAMSPKEKRKHWHQIAVRERNFAENHEIMSADISEARAFEEECDGDENFNHDQPL